MIKVHNKTNTCAVNSDYYQSRKKVISQEEDMQSERIKTIGEKFKCVLKEE